MIEVGVFVPSRKAYTNRISPGLICNVIGELWKRYSWSPAAFGDFRRAEPLKAAGLPVPQTQLPPVVATVLPAGSESSTHILAPGFMEARTLYWPGTVPPLYIFSRAFAPAPSDPCSTVQSTTAEPSS